jgi:hypothetical protein
MPRREDLKKMKLPKGAMLSFHELADAMMWKLQYKKERYAVYSEGDTADSIIRNTTIGSFSVPYGRFVSSFDFTAQSATPCNHSFCLVGCA